MMRSLLKVRARATFGSCASVTRLLTLFGGKQWGTDLCWSNGAWPAPGHPLGVGLSRCCAEKGHAAPAGLSLPQVDRGRHEQHQQSGHPLPLWYCVQRWPLDQSSKAHPDSASLASREHVRPRWVVAVKRANLIHLNRLTLNTTATPCRDLHKDLLNDLVQLSVFSAYSALRKYGTQRPGWRALGLAQPLRSPILETSEPCACAGLQESARGAQRVRGRVPWSKACASQDRAGGAGNQRYVRRL